MVLQTIGKFWLAWIIVAFILELVEKSLHTFNFDMYLKFALIKPILLFAIPIACYFVPILHSAPFSIFLFGRLLQSLFGVKVEDMPYIVNQSYIQRRFGPFIWITSFTLSVIGAAIGGYRLFFK